MVKVNENVNPQVNQCGPVAVFVVGDLLGIAFQNRRIDDLRDSMTKRFEDLRDLLTSDIKRVEGRLERLEHPTVR